MHALGNWRDAGNLFGIVTGRGARTLLADLCRFALPCDFLLCNNGALLLDGRGEYLAERPLEHDLAKHLLGHDIERGCASCALFTGLDMYVLEGGRSWINPVYEPGFMELERALDTRFVQMSFGFDSRSESMAWGESLARELEGRASVQCSLSVVDVTAAGVGKASGIEWALETLGLAPGDILAAGDDGNDTDMLKRFQGFAVGKAQRDVVEAASGRHASSVAAIVDEALRNDDL